MYVDDVDQVDAEHLVDQPAGRVLLQCGAIEPADPGGFCRTEVQEPGDFCADHDARG